MRKIIIGVLFAIALTGCATTGSHQYGNFTEPTAERQQLATDAVEQLATLYPPAKTRFALQQPTPDAFGVALVKALRAEGYALSEFDNAKPAGTTAKQTGALPLRYVLDQAGVPNLYRLTLVVGAQSITRPYLDQNGAFVPAGYWVRKE